jgi:tellurite resistance protein TehA-like permease
MMENSDFCDRTSSKVRRENSMRKLFLPVVILIVVSLAACQVKELIFIGEAEVVAVVNTRTFIR